MVIVRIICAEGWELKLEQTVAFVTQYLSNSYTTMTVLTVKPNCPYKGWQFDVYCEETNEIVMGMHSNACNKINYHAANNHSTARQSEGSNIIG